MVAILEQPDDEVAVVHDDSGLVLCMGCSQDWFDKFRHFVQWMSFARILAT